MLAVLAALAAGPGCSSDPGGELPLKPCGVEYRFLGEEVRLAYTHRAYDERGNHVLSERDFDIDGTIDDRFVWEYAPHGGLTLATQSFSSGITREVAVEYGDGDRLAAVTWTTSSGMAGRADYEYDGEQRIVERWDHDDDGGAEENVTFTYDTGGRLEGSSARCAGVAEPRSLSTMVWDESGRIARIEAGLPGEPPGAVTEFTYDQDGRLQRWERAYDGEVLISEAFEYDAAGRVRGTSSASVLALGQDPLSWQTTDTEYDADGRIRTVQTAVDGVPDAEYTYLYECPEHEDSPGRHVGAPASPLPLPPMGPRGGVGPDAVFTYALTGGSSCP
jgi:hypothetical protein